MPLLLPPMRSSSPRCLFVCDREGLSYRFHKVSALVVFIMQKYYREYF